MSLINLAGRLRALSEPSKEIVIARVAVNAATDAADRSALALLVPDALTPLPAGFAAYLCHSEFNVAGRPNAFLLPPSLNYLADGDVVRIDPRRGSLRTLYRKASASNSFLVTERCDNCCIMCSQPPKEADDAWLIDELLRVVPLVDPNTQSLGITGGEPGLLGPRLIELLGAMKRHLPQTAVHVLSNGRAFANAALAREIASVGLEDLMIGIPLYADLPEDHDYVVQARGAFDETVRGVLNLKRVGVKVELRFVIHAKTVKRLPQFAEFVARNLLFVDQIALMGLELMGFAKTNLDALWLDPIDYVEQLAAAVKTLDGAGVPIWIYNHQLCVLPPALHRFARRSISDWKNWYADECETCAARGECGGFFASAATRRSRGIVPLVREAHAQ